MRSMRPETGVRCRVVGHEQDEHEAPPEDGHGIAGERGAHQRLVVDAAAPRRGYDPGGNAEHDGEAAWRRSVSSRVAGKSVSELGQHRVLGDDGGAEIAVQEGPDIVEELLPDRLVEAHFVPEHRRGAPDRNATLAAAHLDGIARHQADQHEGDEHQGQKGRQRERRAPQDETGTWLVISLKAIRPAAGGETDGFVDRSIRRHRRHRIHGARAG